jgi:hypothetical protein
MPSATWARITVVVAAAVWGLITVIGGAALNTAGLAAVGPTTTVVVYLLVGFDLWLWRVGVVRRVTRRLVLRGTWKATLRTTYADHADKEIPCYLVIRQTYSRISVDALFEQSASRSLSADLRADDGQCLLYYLYRTEARALHREGNPPRRGGAALVVGRKPTLHLDGDYWTEEGTRGSLVTEGYSSTLHDTFAGAASDSYR